jgi:hypothetical protein
MTRFLEKDKKTQVNSNLIGVQVKVAPRPDTESIICGYDMQYADIVQTGDIASYTGYNINVSNFGFSDDLNIDIVIEDVKDGIEVDSVYYSKCTIRFVSDINYTGCVGDTYYFISQPGSGLYRYEEVDGVMVMTQIPYNNSSIFRYNNRIFNLYNTETQNVWYVPATRYYKKTSASYNVFYDASSTEYIVFRDLNQNYVWLGLVPASGIQKNTVSGLQFDYLEYDSVGEWYVWDTSYSSGTVNLILKVYTNSRNPNIGEWAIQNIYTIKYSSITDIVRDEQEDVDCSVSYSVDGETWTDWKENLTDDNNVIANIPRYMYLKFGQDVEITEE